MKRIIIILGGIAVGVVSLTLLWAVNGVYRPVSNEEIAVEVVIEEGSGVQAIAQQFVEIDMVHSVMLFRVYATLSGNNAKLQAGTYTLAKNSSIKEIIKQLSAGDAAINDQKITIIEGWRLQDIEGYLKEQGFDVSDFDKLMSSNKSFELRSELVSGKPVSADWEGYLFPDTYQVYQNSTVQEVIQKMVDNMEDAITDEMLAQVKASSMNFYEILTLASIIEKELRTYEERQVGAGIFLQRIADSYPLESDATVNYITGKKTTRPSYNDVATESPYNTYNNIGLPPTPICNPGIDSIKAVLNAEETDYYFFLTTPEGEAIFSKTYNEHLQNVAKYYP